MIVGLSSFASDKQSCAILASVGEFGSKIGSNALPPLREVLVDALVGEGQHRVSTISPSRRQVDLRQRHHLHTVATSSARPKPTMKARPRARPRRSQDMLKVMVLIVRPPLAEKGRPACVLLGTGKRKT